jgi:hypothetical protein
MRPASSVAEVLYGVSAFQAQSHREIYRKCSISQASQADNEGSIPFTRSNIMFSGTPE